MPVHQRRDVQPRIKQLAALAPHANLAARRLRAARQLVSQHAHQRLMFLLGPVGIRRHLTHQLGLAPARHPAKGRIHIRDAPVQIQRAHAGAHGVFHGAAKACFRRQRRLRLLPPAHETPVHHQHPHRHGRQRRCQPEQRPPHHALGRTPHLRLQRQRPPGPGQRQRQAPCL